MTVTDTRPTMSDFRVAIATAITAVPAYATPPDDVAHIPCAVVGPPTMVRQPALGGLWELRFEVIVIGRRYDMAEVHTELDDLTWAVVADLEDTYRTPEVIPGEHVVAGLAHPSYTITVLASAAYC